MTNKDIWTIKLDWLSIIHLLNLNSIREIPELKKEKAIKKISKLYGTEMLLSLDNEELDLLIVNELKELMHRELMIKARKQERVERRMQNNMIPFKNGGVIRFDPKEFKDLDPNADPEEILKYLYKKFAGKGEPSEGDENDDDQDNIHEDNTGYYI